MKSACAPGDGAHSAARKNAAMAPALPTGIGLNSGQARHSASANVSAAYGPAVRRPISVAGSGLPTQTRSAAAARIPPGTHSGRSALSCSGTQAIGSEADVGELAALRALADMLGERLALEGLDRAVFALDARDREGLAAGERDIGQVDALRQSEELHADAAVRTHRYFLQRENEQPGICRERRDHA